MWHVGSNSRTLVRALPDNKIFWDRSWIMVVAADRQEAQWPLARTEFSGPREDRNDLPPVRADQAGRMIPKNSCGGSSPEERSAARKSGSVAQVRTSRGACMDLGNRTCARRVGDALNTAPCTQIRKANRYGNSSIRQLFDSEAPSQHEPLRNT